MCVRVWRKQGRDKKFTGRRYTKEKITMKIGRRKGRIGRIKGGMGMYIYTFLFSPRHQMRV